LSSNQNRERPRSSKKRRTVQGRGPAGSGTGGQPTTQRVPPARTRARSGSGGSGGIPSAWLAGIAIAVVAVGVGFASGAIRLGGGAVGSTGPGATNAASGPVPAGGIAGCPTAPPPAAAAGTTSVVTIQTAKGAIELTLKADLSPLAVGNFLALAKCGFYDHVVFHRIVPNFVIQGGDGEFGRTGTYDASRVGIGGPGYDITDEPVTTAYGRGTLAMARGRGPNSAGSQFFIVLSDEAQSSLADANTYQILGSVTKGMEVADAIAAAADAEKPSQPIEMTKLIVVP